MSIAKRARAIRLNKGIKQNFVAKQLGYKSPTSLNEIENGRRHLKADQIPVLADALGVDITELFFDEKDRDTRKKNSREKEVV